MNVWETKLKLNPPSDSYVKSTKSPLCIAATIGGGIGRVPMSDASTGGVARVEGVGSDDMTNLIILSNSSFGSLGLFVPLTELGVEFPGEALELKPFAINGIGVREDDFPVGVAPTSSSLSDNNNTASAVSD